MSVKVTLNKSALAVLEDGRKAALENTLEAMEGEVVSMQVVPKDTGALEESMFHYMREGGTEGVLVFDTPYARRLYFHPEYNFRRDMNPNARGLWLDSFIFGEKKEWLVNAFAQFWKLHSKGYLK